MEGVRESDCRISKDMTFFIVVRLTFGVVIEQRRHGAGRRIAIGGLDEWLEWAVLVFA